MLSEVAERWERYRLADIAQINIGGTPSRSNETFWDKTGSGEAWVSIADLKQRIVTTTKETITALGVKNSNVKLVPAGTILMSFKLTIGRVAIAGRDLYTNEAIAAFSLRQGVERDYLYQYLPTFVDMIETEQAVKGKTLNKKTLAEIPVFLPPLNEQKRIAEILSSVDESIQATQAVIAQAERVKKFFASSIAAGTIEQFEPSGFAPITSFCKINPRQKMAKGEVYKFVDMAALPIHSSSVESYSEKPLSSGGAKFQQGDTLFARITPCTENGKLGYVNFLNDNEMGFGSTEFTVFRSNQKHSKIVYVYCYSGILREHAISRMIGSTGRQRVPNDAFSEVELAIYSDEQQGEIVAIFSAIEEIQRTNRKQLAQLQRVKKGLMDDLLTGKVRTV